MNCPRCLKSYSRITARLGDLRICSSCYDEYNVYMIEAQRKWIIAVSTTPITAPEALGKNLPVVARDVTSVETDQ